MKKKKQKYVYKNNKSWFWQFNKTITRNENLEQFFAHIYQRLLKAQALRFIALCKTICVWLAPLRNLNQFEELNNSKFKFQEYFDLIPPLFQMQNFAN